MQNLDLRQYRCPFALLLLKQQLQVLASNSALKVLFSNQDAMQDIRLYLDKKNYYYRSEGDCLTVWHLDTNPTK